MLNCILDLAVSICQNRNSTIEGQCSGIGCCEISIPQGLKQYNTSLRSTRNHSTILDFNPCSYAFLVEKGHYTFKTSDLAGMDFNRGFPVIVDLYIGNQTCEVANKSPDYACVSTNSECIYSPSGLGYFCNFSLGYTGNPYIRGGCQDMDECKLSRNIYPCQGICTNTPGSYNCSCPLGTHSDDPFRKDCIPLNTGDGLSSAMKWLLGLASSLSVLFVVSLLCCLGVQQKNLKRIRKKYFQLNGGTLLQTLVAHDHRDTFKIFTLAELENATNNFDRAQIIGQGGFGVVYKGMLDDNRLIAVKKSLMVNERKSKAFAKEMFILSQINHKHVVKLLGCCLEVEVPMLIYEYIPNGTLYSYIHNTNHGQPIPFSIRVKLALETAEAIRYLHIDASPPILHRDIKSSNILLDDLCSAKVADFGISKLAPQDKMQFATLIQGTWGYLDPECIQTHQLTDKSDVYSYGVILAELLTRKKALYFDENMEEICLASKFISSMNKGSLQEIIDPQLSDEILSDEVKNFCNITLQCLASKGEDRPTMKEVVKMLDVLQSHENHPWVQIPKVMQNLLEEMTTINLDDSALLSLENHILYDQEFAR